MASSVAGASAASTTTATTAAAASVCALCSGSGVGGEGAEGTEASAEAERFVICALSTEVFHEMLAAEAAGVSGGNFYQLLGGHALLPVGLALRKAHCNLKRRRRAALPHGGHHHPRPSVARQVRMRNGELGLQLRHLALEDGDGAHAAVDGILDTRVGLVSERIDGVLALVHRELVQQLGNIAGAEDLVDIGEFVGLVRGEVGREHTFRRAFAAQKLACGTRRARRRRRHSWLPDPKLSQGTTHLSLACALRQIHYLLLV